MRHSVIRPMDEQTVKHRLNIDHGTRSRHENPPHPTVPKPLVTLVGEVSDCYNTTGVLRIVNVNTKSETVFRESRDLEVCKSLNIWKTREERIYGAFQNLQVFCSCRFVGEPVHRV